MKHTGQAIRDAAEKGGYQYRWWKVNELEYAEGYNALQMRGLTEHMHDPEFWKALAKAREWQDTCAFRRSRPGIPREGGRLYRLKPARDSDDPGRLAGQALVSTSSSGQLAGSSSSF